MRGDTHSIEFSNDGSSSLRKPEPCFFHSNWTYPSAGKGNERSDDPSIDQGNDSSTERLRTRPGLYKWGDTPEGNGRTGTEGESTSSSKHVLMIILSMMARDL
jgi:hypothetical protein